MTTHKDTYEISGHGFTVKVTATEDAYSMVGSIVSAIMDATLGAGDAIEVRRTA